MYIQHYFVSAYRCTAHWSIINFTKCSFQYFQCPPGTICSHYNVIDYTPYISHQLLMHILLLTSSCKPPLVLQEIFLQEGERHPLTI